MMHKLTVAALICACLVTVEGMYTKASPVLQVTAKNYDSLIAKSNHTSIVEFYAPWCGHCQNLKPAYEKAATNLAGLAKVAAINCDEEENKPLCGQMGVQGFPTLKIVKPGSKPGRPMVEDYQGARTAKAIVDAVIDKIPNHVKRMTDSGLDTWLNDKKTSAKAVLFTDKGTTGALIKALAVDFLGNIDFAQIRNKEKASVDKFGIQKFPTILLIPSEGQDPIVYDGELKKEALIKFFTQIAPPNPDPAPRKAKTSTTKASKSAASTASSKFAEASKAHKSADFEDHMQKKGTSVVEDDQPTDSPLPIVENKEKPMVVADVAKTIPQLSTASDLHAACLTSKSGHCILVLLPSTSSDKAGLGQLAEQALASFGEVADRHKKRSSNIFPFYGIPTDNEASSIIRKALGLKSESDIEIIAINKKRKWWTPYTATSFGVLDAENFVDAIKLGEAVKQKLPADFYTGTEAPSPEAASEPEAKETADAESSSAAAPEPPAEPSPHDEL